MRLSASARWCFCPRHWGHQPQNFAAPQFQRHSVHHQTVVVAAHQIACGQCERRGHCRGQCGIVCIGRNITQYPASHQSGADAAAANPMAPWNCHFTFPASQCRIRAVFICGDPLWIRVQVMVVASPAWREALGKITRSSLPLSRRMRKAVPISGKPDQSSSDY